MKEFRCCLSKPLRPPSVLNSMVALSEVVDPHVLYTNAYPLFSLFSCYKNISSCFKLLSPWPVGLREMSCYIWFRTRAMSKLLLFLPLPTLLLVLGFTWSLFGLIMLVGLSKLSSGGIDDYLATKGLKCCCLLVNCISLLAISFYYGSNLASLIARGCGSSFWWGFVTAIRSRFEVFYTTCIL